MSFTNEQVSVGTILVCIKEVNFSDGTSDKVGDKIRVDDVNKYYFLFDQNRENYVTYSDYLLDILREAKGMYDD